VSKFGILCTEEGNRYIRVGPKGVGFNSFGANPEYACSLLLYTICQIYSHKISDSSQGIAEAFIYAIVVIVVASLL